MSSLGHNLLYQASMDKFMIMCVITKQKPFHKKKVILDVDIPITISCLKSVCNTKLKSTKKIVSLNKVQLREKGEEGKMRQYIMILENVFTILHT